MRPLTLIMPYYENPGMLLVQLRHLAYLDVDVQNALSLIVVDDGSPTAPALPVLYASRALPLWAGIQFYRIKVDVRWNWIACRNLAMDRATTPWRLMTDIDHIVPEKTLRYLMTTDDLDPRLAYKFRRRDALSLGPVEIVSKHNPKTHPNTWLMTGETFNRAGGYDERFSGCYGSDGEFRDRIEAVTRQKPAPVIGHSVVRVPRALVPDASTTTYTRKDPTLDGDRVQKIRERRRGAAPLRLTFPWERVF